MAEKIDVVYKLGTGCDWGDFDELRYSLRSLSNFKDLGKVFIVGHDPFWTKNVIHIPSTDSYRSNKDGNLISKIILACTHEDLSEQFINFSDDQFLIEPVTKQDFEFPIIENKHIEFGSGKKINKWQRRLRRTIEALKEKGHRYDCYESHVPVMLNKSDYPTILFSYPYGEDIGMCGNTLYFNSKGIVGRKNRVIMSRLDRKFSSQSELKRFIGKAKFLNVVGRHVNETFKQYLKNKFPKKSVYEI